VRWQWQGAERETNYGLCPCHRLRGIASIYFRNLYYRCVYINFSFLCIHFFILQIFASDLLQLTKYCGEEILTRNYRYTMNFQLFINYI
jgi:hypothetical protein